eukprot:Rhum_TRINITY_DN15227_c0_g1::Rhum_TRINITY_DN15227_c0_g1_i1::g.145112::m.145112
MRLLPVFACLFSFVYILCCCCCYCCSGTVIYILFFSGGIYIFKETFYCTFLLLLLLPKRLYTPLHDRVPQVECTRGTRAAAARLAARNGNLRRGKLPVPLQHHLAVHRLVLHVADGDVRTGVRVEVAQGVQVLGQRHTDDAAAAVRVPAEQVPVQADVHLLSLHCQQRIPLGVHHLLALDLLVHALQQHVERVAEVHAGDRRSDLLVDGGHDGVVHDVLPQELDAVGEHLLVVVQTRARQAHRDRHLLQRLRGLLCAVHLGRVERLFALLRGGVVLVVLLRLVLRVERRVVNGHLRLRVVRRRRRGLHGRRRRRRLLLLRRRRSRRCRGDGLRRRLVRSDRHGDGRCRRGHCRGRHGHGGRRCRHRHGGRLRQRRRRVGCGRGRRRLHLRRRGHGRRNGCRRGRSRQTWGGCAAGQALSVVTAGGGGGGGGCLRLLLLLRSRGCRRSLSLLTETLLLHFLQLLGLHVLLLRLRVGRRRRRSRRRGRVGLRTRRRRHLRRLDGRRRQRRRRRRRLRRR